MKIYFAGSIRGGRDDAALYRQIIVMLMEYGEVLTEHGGDASLTRAGEDGPSDGAIYGRDMAWPTPWPPRSPSPATAWDTRSPGPRRWASQEARSETGTSDFSDGL